MPMSADDANTKNAVHCPRENLSIGALAEAWYCQDSPCEDVAGLVGLDLVDYQLINGDHDAARAELARMPADATDVMSRMALISLVRGDSEPVLHLLDQEGCRKTSAGLAVLAWAHYVSIPAGEQRRMLVRDLIDQAVDCDRPAGVAFHLFWRLSSVLPHFDPARRLAVAERGIAEYDYVYLYARRAHALELLGRRDEIDFQQLLELGKTSAICNTTLLELTQTNGPWEVAHAAVDQLGSDDTPELRDRMRLLVHATLYMRQSLLEKESAASAYLALERANDFLLGVAQDKRNGKITAASDEAIASMIRVCAGLVLGQESIVRESANRVGDLFFSDPRGIVDCRDSLVFEGVFIESDMFTMIDRSKVVSLCGERSTWSVMLIVFDFYDGGFDGDEEDSDRRARSLEIWSDWVRHNHAPDWCYEYLSRCMIEAGKPDLALLSKCLFRGASSLYSEGSLPREIEKYDALALSEIASGLIAQVETAESGKIPPNLVESWFLNRLHALGKGELALRLGRLLHERKPGYLTAFCHGYIAYLQAQYQEAAEQYAVLARGFPDDFAVVRNLALALAKQPAPEQLAKLRDTVVSRPETEQARWAELVADIDLWLPDARRQHVKLNLTALAKARMQVLNRNRLTAQHTPADLTLGQSTALLALLRSGNLDHAKWTVGPVCDESVPFSPTDRFLSFLSQLVDLGVLGIDSVRNNKILATASGVEFDWSGVAFLLEPATLELQRAIRDLPREQWPDSWGQELETLAISLGVEECMAYIEHLADERNLGLPPANDLRAVYRNQLQVMSIGQAWYCTDRTMRDTSDYLRKYPAGKPQMISYQLRKLRELGERLVENRWDTSYKRISALPRSNFAAALHDVLSGWNDRPMDTRIRDLVV